MRLYIILTLFLLTGYTIYADNNVVDTSKMSVKNVSTDILQRIRYNNSSTYNFLTAGLTNPAVKKIIPTYTLTSLNFSLEHNSQDNSLIVQEGDGFNDFTIKTKSHINRIYSVWGQAYYNQGKQRNVQLNENSDYQIIYPYVIADTIGGDFNFEKYYFSGGYAQKFNKLLVGIYADYRASLHYRTVDPRPYNTVGDLGAKVGFMYKLFKSKYVGASISFRKYKQKSELNFYSIQGSYPIFHFLGMGMLYKGRGNSEAVQHFNGRTFNFSVDILSENSNGFSASINYSNFTLDKIIHAMNYFPLNHINERVLYGELYYLKNFKYGAKLKFMHKNRKGKENLPGAPVNESYPILVSQDQYSSKHTNALLILVYNNTSLFNTKDVLKWSILPTIAYSDIEFSYKHPFNKIQVKSFTSGFDLELNKELFKRSGLLKLDFGFLYHSIINSDIILNNNSTDYINSMLHSNFSNLSSSFQHYNISLTYNHKVSSNNIIYLKSTFKYNKYSNKNNLYYYLISIGYQF